jgi:hypothetical protein
MLNAQPVPPEYARQGDIVEINGVPAIVFQTYGDGHGKAMALNAFRGAEKAWCINGKSSKVKTTDNASGKTNTEAVYSFVRENNLDISIFPVFAWCKSLGDGWYIPSVSEMEAFVNYWVGNSSELDWDDDTDVPQQPAASSGGRNITYGQNEHTKKVNKNIVDAGGVPFSTGVFSSTEKKGKILVFEYKIYKIDMPWEMKAVAKSDLSVKHSARAFFDY